jgi:hypothetical protein
MAEKGSWEDLELAARTASTARPACRTAITQPKNDLEVGHADEPMAGAASGDRARLSTAPCSAGRRREGPLRLAELQDNEARKDEQEDAPYGSECKVS